MSVASSTVLVIEIDPNVDARAGRGNPLSFDGYRVSTQWQKCKSKRASAAQFSEQCQFIRARHQVYQSNWRRISLESPAKPVQKELTSLNQLSFMINDRFLSSFFPLARKSFRQLPIFYVRSLCFQNKFPMHLFLVLRPRLLEIARWNRFIHITFSYTTYSIAVFFVFTRISIVSPICFI